VPMDLMNQLFATLAGWKRDGHVDQGVLWILDDHARGLLDASNANLIGDSRETTRGVGR
jgi:hypothetical protein